MLLTALVGMLLSTEGAVDTTTMLVSFVGLALAMGGSAAVNHAVDQQVDRIMQRTHDRPVATGKIPLKQASWFAGGLIVAGLGILFVWVNTLTAVLTLFGVVGYAFIYTLYLKRATPQNIVIGGLAGAIPPLLGWTAMTGAIHPHGLLLALLIFVWTPPHFWVLAMHRREEYAKVNIPMLPVTHGLSFTATQVLLYTVLLVLCSLLPWITGMSSWIYATSAMLLGGVYLYYGVKLKWFPEKSTAMKSFGYSITYLLALFVALLVDHYWA